MANSQHNLSVTASGLREYLETIIPFSQLTERQLDSTHEPLVLLQTNHIAAGFGFSNGDLDSSYDIAYKTFKTHYSEQLGNWDSLDLAFVFCVAPTFPNLDRFCSAVETDVFFCRKFVVPIGLSLSSSLARLPFIPLTPATGNSFRPPSAQTLLQQTGVPALLAKYVVVPRERGPERIIDDCISGEFGEPQELSVTKTQRVAATSEHTDSVSLEEITIENFRAYRKPQTFKLGADITVLYGPNGFGKTSFFDAVDFAVTGGIGRFGTKPDSQFSKLAQHLDSAKEESVVKAVFQSKGVSRRIVRDVRHRNSASLDGHSTDRKNILSELTGREISVSDRVDNAVNLFRATHLFSQELQELTRNFRDNCRLSKEIVSPMLALQDYAAALTKIQKIIEQLNGSLQSAEKEIGELEQQIGDCSNEIQRLNPQSDYKTGIELFDLRVQALSEKLIAEGIQPGTVTPSVTTIRKWTSLITEAHSRSLNKANRLSALIKELPELHKAHSQLSELENQIKTSETSSSALDEKRITAENALQTVQKELSVGNGKLLILQSKSKLFEWFELNREAYSQAKKSQAGLKEQIAQVKLMLEKLRSNDQKAARELAALNRNREQANDSLRSRQTALEIVEGVFRGLEAWKRNIKDVGAIPELESTVNKSIETLRVEQKDLSSRLSVLNTDETRLVLHIEALDRSQSELRSLLLGLQAHIKSALCPLCGEDHGTQANLTDQVQRQLKHDPAAKMRSELSETREKIRVIKEAVAANSQKLNSAELEYSKIRMHRPRLQAEIETFEKTAAAADLLLNASTPNPEELTRAKIGSVKEAIDQLKLSIAQSTESINNARNIAEVAKAALDSKLADEAKLLETLKGSEEQVSEFTTDPRWLLLSLETPPDQVAIQKAEHANNLDAFTENLKRVQEDAEKRRAEIAVCRKDLEVSMARVQSLRRTGASLQKSIAQLTARINEAGLSLEIKEEDLLKLLVEETKTQERLVTIRNEANGLELAIDAATTAAALRNIQQTMRNKEKALAETKSRQTNYKPWLTYFKSLEKVLISQQQDAIRSFTDDYGPRTSVIQRRLRSVYGFDDVEIRSSESDIEVRVRRHGEELRPTDYFSQSQQQTLVLGLFLTACISQTWSGFSPIFMDDPVTHFDDLNIYSFLDLILGLLKSDHGKRQFVISTCDEKLLQLALQKFNHLGNRAVFYRFEAMCADGPVVTKLEVSA